MDSPVSKVNYLSLIVSLDFLRFLVICCFLIVVLLIVFRYLWAQADFWKNDKGEKNLLPFDNKGVQKMIGGISVFIVALISNNSWAITVSLFIGGLIIASEEFMSNLAIIVKSESKDMKDNLKANHLILLNKQEEQEKIEKKVDEVLVTTPEAVKPSKKRLSEDEWKMISPVNSSTNRLEMTSNLIKIEDLIAEYFNEKWYNYEQNIRSKNIIFDGIIKWNNDEIKEIIEIKYYRTLFNMKNIEQVIDRIRRYSETVKIKICIVMDTDAVTSAVWEKRFRENVIKWKDIEMLFFKFNDSKLEYLYTIE